MLSGKALNQTSIKAYVDDQELSLKTYDEATGYFEFFPSNLLTVNKQVRIVFEKNGEELVINKKVMPAPAPNKPLVDPISNKSTYITGSAEAYSTVYIKTENKMKSIKLENTNTFCLPVEKGLILKAGTYVSIYIIDKAGRKSGVVKIKVADKVSPAVPKIDGLSDKMFSIKGSTEPNAKLYILKGNKRIASIQTNSTGKFTYRMPIQKANTIFKFFAVDVSGNKSKIRSVKVKAKKRPSQKILNAPVVKQMPELARGCEVQACQYYSVMQE
ncbi:Ig-like domain-containing protein [Heyndrickxia sporothermodurans]